MVGVDPELGNLFDEDRNTSALADTGKMLDNKPESLLLKSPDPEDRTKHGIYQSIISLAKACGIEFESVAKASPVASRQ